jgi:hypothetical protein
MTTKTKRAKRTPKARKAGNAVISKTPLPTQNITARRIGGTTADVSDYVRCKTANGHVSLHNGDDVAKKLAGKELADVYAIVSKETEIPQTQLKTRYGHLNPGMQRMNLGNVLRGALRAE